MIISIEKLFENFWDFVIFVIFRNFGTEEVHYDFKFTNVS